MGYIRRLVRDGFPSFCKTLLRNEILHRKAESTFQKPLAIMSQDMYECGVCADNFQNPPEKTVAGASLCRDCIINTIIPMFWDATKDLSKYPVVWSAGVLLQPEDFIGYFGEDTWEDFYGRWNNRKAEHATPRRLRLYCQSCQIFAGERNSNGATDQTIDFIWCFGCGAILCCCCGSSDHDFKDCMHVDEQDDKSLDKVNGVKRCPNELCELPVVLGEGCNECECHHCMQKFCFHCMAKNPAADHWTVGQTCPRFGRSDDPNPIFDGIVNNDDESNAGSDDRFSTDETGQINFHGEHQTFWNDRMVLSEDVGILVTLEVEGSVSVLLNLPPPLPAGLNVPNFDNIVTLVTESAEFHHQVLDMTMGGMMQVPQELLDAESAVGTLRSLLEALKQNLDIYTWRTRNPDNAGPYRTRHLEVILPLAHGWFEDEDARFWAWDHMFYHVLITYLSISAERFQVEGMVWRDPETRHIRGNMLEHARQIWARDAQELAPAGLLNMVNAETE